MRLCVFTGSQPGLNPQYAEVATELGIAFARAGIELVYGGGDVGLMGIVAHAAMDAGGIVHGVIPQHLLDVEIGGDFITNLEVVPDMHTRKARMAELSDGFVALPGGIGTLEELFEMWTWQQLGIQAKPVALFNIGGFWDRLLAFVDQQVADGFVRRADRDALIVVSTPATLIDACRSWEAPAPKWASEESPLV